MAQTLVKTIADFSTTLASKVSAGATSATLTSATDSDGVALPSGTYGFTIDRGESTKEHFTASLSGTALTDIKHVTRGTGVGSSGLTYAHRKGAEIIISDHVSLKRVIDILDGTNDLDSGTPLKYDGNPTISDDAALATKKYADDLAIAGSPDASTSTKGISKMSVAPASATEPIAVGDNDPRVPTADENDALAGTSGTPSATNKYVTADDVTEAKTASKIPRRDSNSDILVATTPTAGDAATSKTYVDTAISGVTAEYANGVTTRAGDTASGDQTIAHGLGRVPKFIRITVTKTNSTVGGLVQSTGVYNGTTNSCVWGVGYDNGNGSTAPQSGNSSTQVAYVAQTQPGATGTQTAVATFDATNITLTWTKSGTVNASNMNIMWEAEV